MSKYYGDDRTEEGFMTGPALRQPGNNNNNNNNNDDDDDDDDNNNNNNNNNDDGDDDDDDDDDDDNNNNDYNHNSRNHNDNKDVQKFSIKNELQCVYNEQKNYKNLIGTGVYNSIKNSKTYKNMVQS